MTLGSLLMYITPHKPDPTSAQTQEQTQAHLNTQYTLIHSIHLLRLTYCNDSPHTGRFCGLFEL